MATIAELRKRVEPADHLIAQGRFHEAVAALTPLAEEGVAYFRPFHNLGALNVKLRQYDKAIDYLKASIERNPDFWETHFVLGQAYLESKRAEDAVTALGRAVELAPDNVRSGVWLARAHWQRGDRDAASVAVRDIAGRIGWPTPKARGLVFSQEPWFLAHIPNWRNYLAPILGRAGRALEIGCMEGMSGIWTIENVLAPDGRILVNDLMFRENFLDNIRKAGVDHRATLRPGSSELVLPFLPPDRFDFAYVDGDHRPAGAFRDAVNALIVVLDEGFIVLDDFGKDNESTAIGLGLFLEMFADQIEVLHKTYQVFLRRRAPVVRLTSRALRLIEDALDPASRADFAALPADDAARLAWLRHGKAQLRS